MSYFLQHNRFSPQDPLKLNLDCLISSGCCVNGDLNKVFFLLSRLKLTMATAATTYFYGQYHHQGRVLTSLGEVNEIIQNLKDSVASIIDDAGELEQHLDDLQSVLPHFIRKTDDGKLLDDGADYEKKYCKSAAVAIPDGGPDDLPF